jgi:hypothetical protein
MPRAEALATLWTLNPLEIEAFDHVRREGGTALRVRLVQRRQHFFWVEFS